MKETDPITRHHGRAENGGGMLWAAAVPREFPPCLAVFLSLRPACHCCALKSQSYLPCSCALMLPCCHKSVDPNQVAPKTPEQSQMLPWVKNICVKSSG